MGVSSFDGLLQHFGHSVVIVTYGTPPVNVAIECLDCNEVLFDFDKANNIESREVWGTTWYWEDVVSQLDDLEDVFTALPEAKKEELVSKHETTIAKHLEAGIMYDWIIAMDGAIDSSGLREDLEAINLESKTPR